MIKSSIFYAFCFFVLIFSCSTSKNQTQKERLVLFYVMGIKEYANTYLLKGFENNNRDTLYAVTMKKGFHWRVGVEEKRELKSLNKIIEGEKYLFEVSLVKPRVSTMEQLGAYLIVENDTIVIKPSSQEILQTYIIHNTIGLYLLK